jgi:hypothetical protein
MMTIYIVAAVIAVVLILGRVQIRKTQRGRTKDACALDGPFSELVGPTTVSTEIPAFEAAKRR